MATTRKDMRRAAEESRGHGPIMFGSARVEDGEFRSMWADFRRVHSPCDRASWSNAGRRAVLDMTNAHKIRRALP